MSGRKYFFYAVIAGVAVGVAAAATVLTRRAGRRPGQPAPVEIDEDRPAATPAAAQPAPATPLTTDAPAGLP
jgi:hypothetical protein